MLIISLLSNYIKFTDSRCFYAGFIEGAGAVGIAALLAGKAPVGGRRTGIVVSGGNIDEAKLLKVLAENR